MQRYNLWVSSTNVKCELCQVSLVDFSITNYNPDKIITFLLLLSLPDFLAGKSESKRVIYEHDKWAKVDGLIYKLPIQNRNRMSYG